MRSGTIGRESVWVKAVVGRRSRGVGGVVLPVVVFVLAFGFGEGFGGWTGRRMIGFGTRTIKVEEGYSENCESHC